jgi:hypothetical protein
MVDGELGFRGTTSIMASGAKTEVTADRFFAKDSHGLACRWWGSYHSGDGPVDSGRARMRFSDGTEADVEIEATSRSEGRFVVIGTLRSLEQNR